MEKLTLNVSGITIPAAFNTMIKQIIDPTGASKIVLDNMPNIQISLDGKVAKTLGLKKGMFVSVTPIEGDQGGGTFTLEETKSLEPSKTEIPTRGASLIPGYSLSNDLL